MYAIQEPIVGMISGLIGSISRLRENKINHITYDLIINQILSFLFVAMCFLFLIK
jgi:large-conductance mechanosensitive channel